VKPGLDTNANRLSFRRRGRKPRSTFEGSFGVAHKFFTPSATAIGDSVTRKVITPLKLDEWRRTRSHLLKSNDVGREIYHPF
jgi:hypothetical protein